MKTVNVILTFHAHEPLWDLPGHIQRQQGDVRVAQAIAAENYLRKRAKEGRNIYRDLITFARIMNLKATLDISNDLLHQIRMILPRTFEEVRKAYQSGLIYPLYTTAHHTHASLLEPQEMIEELRWNEQFIHDIIGAPRPRHRGFFFTECSVHPQFFPALEAAGIEFVVHPDLNERKGVFTISDPAYDHTYRPFCVGTRLLALPRHFRVSQEIWRPITRMYPQEVKYQGFLMGSYFVFDTEYQEKRTLDFPIDRTQGIAEYRSFIEQALDEAPDGGLIFYIQDLELMDFGDVALEVLREAWKDVLARTAHEVRFVTPDEYLDALPARPAVQATVQGMGWAPETRVLLRSDGHYPPLFAGEHQGTDVVPQIFRSHPFIYWEPGKYLVGLFSWLLRVYGFSPLVDVHARVMSDEEYQVYRFPYEKRIALGLRLLKQADNWGWQPNEILNKRPYVYGLMLADSLLVLQRFYPSEFPKSDERIDPRLLIGLGRLPEGLIDTRIAYLRFGLDRLHEERADFEPSEAYRQLDYAQDFRDKAGRGAEYLIEAYRGLEGDFRNQERWQRLLLEAREHCRNVFLAFDHLQRCWIAAGETDFLIESMYRYLYDLYPPRFPEILDEVDRGAVTSDRVYMGMRLLHFTIKPDSAVAGRRLRDTTVAGNSLIVSLRRSRQMLVPRGDTVLQPGDSITVATTTVGELRLEDILGAKV